MAAKAPVKINPALPDAKSQDNGLDEARAEAILRSPHHTVVAVVLMNARHVEQDLITGERIPKLDIVAVEIMEGADEALAMDMVSLYREVRTGQMETRPTKLVADRRRADYAAGRAVAGGGRQESLLDAGEEV